MAIYSDNNVPLRSTIGVGPRGNGVYLSSKTYTFSNNDIYLINSADFNTSQRGNIHGVRVGDVVIFKTLRGNTTQFNIGVVDLVNGDMLTVTSRSEIDVATMQEIADSSVTTRKINDGSVTTPKIANNSVTLEKLGNSVVNSIINSIPLMSSSVAGKAKVGAGLRMTGDGKLELDGSGDIATAVTAWLNAHPEATTTVQNGSITDVKIAPKSGNLPGKVIAADELSFAEYTSTYSSFDNAPANSIIRLVNYGGVQSIPNSPSGEKGTLITFGDALLMQYYIEQDSGIVYSRYQLTVQGVNVYQDWTSYKKIFSTSFSGFVNDYQTADNAPYDSVIRLESYAGVSSIPNLPSGRKGTLFTFGGYGSNQSQFYVEQDGSMKVFFRYQISSSADVHTWESWVCLNNAWGMSEYIIDKNGSNTDVSSTSLLEGLTYCYDNYIKNIRVRPGTYDMVAEYQEKYGSNWDTVVGNSMGIAIGRGMRIVFDEGAKVTFEYTGGRSNIHSYMSLFNTSASDCYVEGLDFVCSNIRYGLHDDCSGQTTPYVHTFKDCKVIKTDNNLDWTSSFAIAGGFGSNARIEIDGGVFKCENTAASEQNDTIYYHNNSSLTGSKARVIIHGIYCYGPIGSLHSGGQIQNDGIVAEMLVYGCRFNREPIQNEERAIVMKKWGNTIEQD